MSLRADAAGVANINNTAKSSRRPISMSAASTIRAGREKTKKFDVGPASPMAGPMLDIELITADKDSSSGAPVAVTTSVPISVIVKKVVRNPMTR